MKTIIVCIGGRWYDDPTYGLHYRHGYTHYIHNVLPQTFKFMDLLRALMMMLQYEGPPTRLWYHRNGVQFPNGLQVLQSEAHMQSMWINCFNHDSRVAVVFAHDKTVETSADLQTTLYQLPARVPLVDPPFDRTELYTEAYHYQLMDERVGPPALWRKESVGNSWYVSSESVPRVYGA